MKRLIKMSDPGWIKEFETEDEVRRELYNHLCSMCIEGDGVTEETTLDHMLWTACGCEYTVDDGGETNDIFA